MFRLTKEETRVLMSHSAAAGCSGNQSQIATASQRHRDPRFPPYAFTEYGAIMAANVLNSPQAVRMSVFVKRVKYAVSG